MDPAYPNGRYHLAIALGDSGYHDEARTHLEHVIQAEPEKAEAHNSLGYLALTQRQVDKAVSYLRRAIELRPNYTLAHVNLAMGLLQLGDYPRGFAEYEWRSLNDVHCPHPKWDGHEAPDKTLLIYAEQGPEDAVQFSRYLPLAAERCKDLILACSPDLMPIFATIPGLAHIRDKDKIAVTEFDTYLPLMSLPHVLGTTLDTVPATVPYLDALALRRRNNNPSLTLPITPQRKIGVAWASSPDHSVYSRRSCPLNEFLPILGTKENVFYSLDGGEHQDDLTDLPSSMRVQDIGGQLGDFGNLAVIIDQLDLVITVDSPVAHLAGALGKPVWTLLSHVADWRWRLEGETTPWYPTMRLFRQTQPGDWTGVIERVAAALGSEKKLQSAIQKRTTNPKTQIAQGSTQEHLGGRL